MSNLHFTTDPAKRRAGYVYDATGFGVPIGIPPEIIHDHIDERPVLLGSDGRSHQLTLWERVQLRLDLTDVFTLDRKYRRRA